MLWQVALDGAGEVRSVDVRRARVRSTAQLDYEGVQKAADGHALPDAIALLPVVGQLRRDLARKRHAIDLGLPEQVVEGTGPNWTLRLRSPLPVENFNAEISLLVGACAARIMLDAKVGILRTVPPPDGRSIDALRRVARALGIDWPAGEPPGDVLAALHRDDPRHFAFLDHAASLLRGAAYANFDGAPPAQTQHAGIGSPYAHVTAPLRRLVDRFGSEVCLAVHAGQPVPEWARAALPALPEEMRIADHLAHEADRAVVDATEAWLLHDRIGTDFSAVVIDADEHAGTVVLDDPPVRARCDGAGPEIGKRISVRLVSADVATRQVRFAATPDQL